jgi:hypothetical protein
MNKKNKLRHWSYLPPLLATTNEIDLLAIMLHNLTGD